MVLSGMGVLSGGWFLHRIGISTCILHATLCFIQEIHTIILVRISRTKQKVGMYYMHVDCIGDSSRCHT